MLTVRSMHRRYCMNHKFTLLNAKGKSNFIYQALCLSYRCSATAGSAASTTPPQVRRRSQLGHAALLAVVPCPARYAVPPTAAVTPPPRPVPGRHATIRLPRAPPTPLSPGCSPRYRRRPLTGGGGSEGGRGSTGNSRHRRVPPWRASRTDATAVRRALAGSPSELMSGAQGGSTPSWRERQT